MRHDSHFVEELTAAHSESIGRLVDISRIEPNPHQPRKDFGDLDEMVASVKEKGILEPILVRNHEGNYQIIAGERRYQAALMAGLQRLPCIEVDVDTRGMLEISLIENLQRRDLTPFEEAAALQRLCDQFRYTHDEIARKLGKSRTVITETLSLTKMPEDVQERCRQADIVSKSMLLQIVRQETAKDMHQLIDRISGAGINRDEARQFKREDRPPRRGKSFTFRYEPQDDEFSFRVTFRKQNVARDELIATLERILNSLRHTDPAEFASKRTITAEPVYEDEPDDTSGRGRASPRSRRRRPAAISD
jgi:ParB family chromosome partitioning protein